MWSSKRNLIILIFIIILLIVVVLQHKCTGDTHRLEPMTEADTVSMVVRDLMQPVDTMVIQPVVEVEKEQETDKRTKRKPIVPVDTKAQEMTDDVKDDEVTPLPEVTPVSDVKKAENKPETPETPTDVDEGDVHEESVPKEMKAWNRHFYLKTNAIGWGMGITNLAFEMDLAKHWSFTLPVYYAAWNYFDSTVKFRTFAVQPEVRYWFSEENQGLFTGAHIGMAYYNVAWGGDYRYQDHNRNTPAIGGGLSVGYRKPLGKSQRWKVEVSLGVGVYPLHYDKFHNTTDSKDGLMVDSQQKTYWGIDQASVSFAYTLDFKRKGGKR